MMESDRAFPSNDWADLAAIACADSPASRDVLMAAFLADREGIIWLTARRCARRVAGVEWPRDADEVIAVVVTEVVHMVADVAEWTTVRLDGQWPTILWVRSTRAVQQWQADRVSRLLAVTQ